jgi:hypothetical protein
MRAHLQVFARACRVLASFDVTHKRSSERHRRPHATLFSGTETLFASKNTPLEVTAMRHNNL